MYFLCARFFAPAGRNHGGYLADRDARIARAEIKLSITKGLGVSTEEAERVIKRAAAITMLGKFKLRSEVPILNNSFFTSSTNEVVESS